MKLQHLFIGLTVVMFMFTQCKKDVLTDGVADDSVQTKSDEISSPPDGSFTVTIENISDDSYEYYESGVFHTPVGAEGPGPLLPGHSYSFSFHAVDGYKLSFATMFVKSNDLFYGPSDAGLDLFVGGSPVTGDITNMIYLWDAGTEVNEEPGIGPNQPLNGGPGVGIDEGGNVMMVNDGFTYPDVSDNIEVMLHYDGISKFTVTITNVSSEPDVYPLAPGIFTVSTSSYALYKDGMSDYGHGLEALAEDGAASELHHYVVENTGFFSPLAPGVFVIHKKGYKPVFQDGKMDYGQGLEALAEDGDPSGLYASLMADEFVSGVFNTPDGAAGPGPLLPGNSYSFTFEAKAGEYLSFATMLVPTNDLFFAPENGGIKLFTGQMATEGDITSMIQLWDAGTEMNEAPFIGPHQPLNGGPDTGSDENGYVLMVNDGFSYPEVDDVIKVTIVKN